MRYVLKRLFGEELTNLLLLNLLTAAFCLPVITAGPAVLALNGTLIKIVDNRCDLNRIKEFWGLFKKKFLPGVLMELIVAAYAGLLIWCASLVRILERGGKILLILIMLAGLLAAVVSVCLSKILACVQGRFGENFWNAVCMALGCLPRALLAAAFVYGLGYAAVLLYPISILLYAIAMLSVMATLSLSALWPPLQELVLDPRSDGDAR